MGRRQIVIDIIPSFEFEGKRIDLSMTYQYGPMCVDRSIRGTGAGSLRENAEATAELINKRTPYLIFTGTIHADPGCPLYDDMQSGRFVEPTIGEHIDEEELFLQLLEIDNCLYFGLHPSNVVRMQGWLGRDKDAMLAEVRRTREMLGRRLDERPVRYGEGAILL